MGLRGAILGPPHETTLLFPMTKNRLDPGDDSSREAKPADPPATCTNVTAAVMPSLDVQTHPERRRSASRGPAARRARRDEEFEAFFLSTYPGLLRTMTAIAGDAELAADALQDAYQRAYARWSRISRYDQPAAWIRRVAINRSRDLARSEARRRSREERAIEPQTVEAPTFDDAIPRMLSQLPDRQRTAMALFYIDGLSVEQTADAMGLSTGAVKFHLNKGRAKLRPLLENRAGDDD